MLHRTTIAAAVTATLTAAATLTATTPAAAEPAVEQAQRGTASKTDCDRIDLLSGSARVCLTVRYRLQRDRGVAIRSMRLAARDDDRLCERFEEPQAYMDHWRIDARNASGKWLHNVAFHDAFNLNGCVNTVRFDRAVRVNTAGWSVQTEGKARMENALDERVYLTLGGVNR